MMDETGTRFCVKNTAFPTCSRTLDWDTEALRINDVTHGQHAQLESARARLWPQQQRVED